MATLISTSLSTAFLTFSQMPLALASLSQSAERTNA